MDDDDNFGFGDFPYDAGIGHWQMIGRECGKVGGFTNGYVGVAVFDEKRMLIRSCDTSGGSGWNVIMCKDDVMATIKMLARMYHQMGE